MIEKNRNSSNGIHKFGQIMGTIISYIYFPIKPDHLFKNKYTRLYNSHKIIQI
jgi:hypothetical protein